MALAATDLWAAGAESDFIYYSGRFRPRTLQGNVIGNFQGFCPSRSSLGHNYGVTVLSLCHSSTDICERHALRFNVGGFRLATSADERGEGNGKEYQSSISRHKTS
jgi:hypothetical protein